MGSKRAMLANGLGKLILSEGERANRIVDLFTGSASVAWFASARLPKKVHAYDLQQYAAVLAGAVIERTKPISSEDIVSEWILESQKRRLANRRWKEAFDLDFKAPNTATWVARAREMCASGPRGSLFSAYGGHYFSPTQAWIFEDLGKHIPFTGVRRLVCLAALIIAAGKCAASPGHTAQPFQPTRTGGRHVRSAWTINPLEQIQSALKIICPLHAGKMGKASVGDAVEQAKRLSDRDLVFVDPPYSGVHYSRFYHVLESIARGHVGSVDGIGRYPDISKRPHSKFSIKTESEAAIELLLKRLSNTGATVIITFPASECSNGLSGNYVEETAEKYFKIKRRVVKTLFSTLGGRKSDRGARKLQQELMLVLRKQ